MHYVPSKLRVCGFVALLCALLSCQVEEETSTMRPGGSAYDCDEIDLLFVVDNSCSMYDEQTALGQSFASFISTIESELDTPEYHIMVVDSDDGPSSGCWDYCAKYDVDECYGYSCDALGAYPSGCDATLGAGVIAPPASECGLDAERRFMTKNTSDLSETFSCAANVGILGQGEERMMQAMTTAVSDGLTGTDDCNAAFLRDDALLLVTFLSDEPDENSTGNPTTWRQALIDAKGGVEEAIVVLGLFGDNDEEDALCEDPTEGDYSGAYAAPLLQEFVDSFHLQGLSGSICEESYDSFFSDAVALLDAHCG